MSEKSNAERFLKKLEADLERQEQAFKAKLAERAAALPLVVRPQWRTRLKPGAAGKAVITGADMETYLDRVDLVPASAGVSTNSKEIFQIQELKRNIARIKQALNLDETLQRAI